MKKYVHLAVIFAVYHFASGDRPMRHEGQTAAQINQMAADQGVTVSIVSESVYDATVQTVSVAPPAPPALPDPVKINSAVTTINATAVKTPLEQAIVDILNQKGLMK